MKIRNLINYSLILIVTIFISCDDSGTGTNPEEVQSLTGEIEKYTSSQGISYEYEIDTLNEITQEYDNIGEREFKINGETLLNNIKYFSYSEKYTLNNEELYLNTFVRIFENSILVFADTNGVSQFIPDSLKNTLKLDIDQELLIFKLPLTVNEEWHVFKGSANFGTFKFKVFDVSAKYIGSEEIVIEDSNTITAEKVEYKIELNIPDINNPFVSNSKIVEAFLWFAEGKGIVKMEGSTWLIKPLTGYAFSFADQNTIIRHNLVSED